VIFTLSWRLQLKSERLVGSNPHAFIRGFSLAMDLMLRLLNRCRLSRQFDVPTTLNHGSQSVTISVRVAPRRVLHVKSTKGPFSPKSPLGNFWSTCTPRSHTDTTGENVGRGGASVDKIDCIKSILNSKIREDKRKKDE